MKIAYIFCGHSRTWKSTHESFFENIFSIAPGDIFIHTWDKVNASTGSYWNGWIDLTGDKLNLSNQLTDFTGIYQTYKPKILIAEEHPTVDITQFNDPRIDFKATYAVKYYLNARRKIFEIAKNYNNYDYFFVSRLDIKYSSKFDINELLTNKLITPNDGGADRHDLFIMGSENYINIHTKFAYDLEDYWYKSGLYKQTIFYEHVLKKYLHEHGINFNINVIRSNLKFDIIRLF